MLISDSLTLLHPLYILHPSSLKVYKLMVEPKEINYLDANAEIRNCLYK